MNKVSAVEPRRLANEMHKCSEIRGRRVPLRSKILIDLSANVPAVHLPPESSLLFSDQLLKRSYVRLYRCLGWMGLAPLF